MSFETLQTLNTIDGSITYRDQGEGHTWVFLHGLAGNSKSWVNQFQTFSTSRRIIAWDAPGFGGSSPVKPDIKIFANVLLQLIEKLDLSSISLIGHSMGG